MKNTYLTWLIGAIVVVLFLLGLLIFFQSIRSSLIIVLFLELLALALLVLMVRTYRIARQGSQGWRLQQDLLSLFVARLPIDQRGRSIGTILNTITVAVVTVMLAWLILLWTGTAIFGNHTSAAPRPGPVASPISTPTKISKPTPIPKKTPVHSGTPSKNR